MGFKATFLELAQMIVAIIVCVWVTAVAFAIALLPFMLIGKLLL